jgi:hypothetical protein
MRKVKHDNIFLEKFIMNDEDDGDDDRSLSTIVLIILSTCNMIMKQILTLSVDFLSFLLHLPMSEHIYFLSHTSVQFVGLIFFQLNIFIVKKKLFFINGHINSTKWPLVNSSSIMNSFNCIRPNNCSSLYYFTYLVYVCQHKSRA